MFLEKILFSLPYISFHRFADFDVPLKKVDIVSGGIYITALGISLALGLTFIFEENLDNFFNYLFSWIKKSFLEYLVIFDFITIITGISIIYFITVIYHLNFFLSFLIFGLFVFYYFFSKFLHLSKDITYVKNKSLIINVFIKIFSFIIPIINTLIIIYYRIKVEGYNIMWVSDSDFDVDLLLLILFFFGLLNLLFIRMLFLVKIKLSPAYFFMGCVAALFISMSLFDAVLAILYY